MRGVKLEGYTVNELDLSNELQGPGQLDIESRTTFNVQYIKDTNRCVANCIIDLMKKDAPNEFNFKISIKGMFLYEEGMDRKLIHTETYDALFPYIRLISANVFVNAGMPPIPIQKVKMDTEKINVSGEGVVPPFQGGIPS